ncbi:hypothetical protein L596_025680 [Steinernema carpocapsae]|uniref:Uncharacterized protein n=1 Tax=Steinernema carpocapsae TaxID=34508 RepID=A0A4U5M8H3_STECR|nr:hypothetical protein L596_025680 [Steinernema carpocapsae]
MSTKLPRQPNTCDQYAVDSIYVADRRDFFNPCLYGGRLFQQFMVDNWVKVEQQRAAPFVAEAESENAQG